ncbi:MAG: hypothetical protein AAGC88_02320, partial [Bacteroidota bacterium]
WGLVKVYAFDVILPISCEGRAVSPVFFDYYLTKTSIKAQTLILIIMKAWKWILIIIAVLIELWIIGFAYVKAQEAMAFYLTTREQQQEIELLREQLDKCQNKLPSE